MFKLYYDAFKVLVLVAVASLAGCTSSEETQSANEKPKPETNVDAGVITLATEESAVLYFQKRAREIFEDKKNFIKNPKLIDQLDDKKNISAKRKNLRECYKRIQDTLTEEQQQSSIMHGKLENLGFLDDAWEIEVGQFEINMGACIDIKTGRVKVLWINQESTISEGDDEVEQPEKPEVDSTNNNLESDSTNQIPTLE